LGSILEQAVLLQCVLKYIYRLSWVLKS